MSLMDRANELEVKRRLKEQEQEVQNKVQERNSNALAQSVTNEPIPVKSGGRESKITPPKVKKWRAPKDLEKLEIPNKSTHSSDSRPRIR